MHVLIIGAAGMVGRKLTQAIAAVPTIDGVAVDALTLVDVMAPQAPAGFTGNVTCKSADISDPRVATALIADRPDQIFHLAAIVSGEAEVAFEKGYAINLDGTRFLLEAIRQQGEIASYRPRVVFTSSIAVFGAPFPDRIDDEFFLTPRTSYGTQSCRSPKPSGTGMSARAGPWVSCCTQLKSTLRGWDIAVCSICRVFPQPLASRSKHCAGWPVIGRSR